MSKLVPIAGFSIVSLVLILWGTRLIWVVRKNDKENFLDVQYWNRRTGTWMVGIVSLLAGVLVLVFGLMMCFSS
jgi:hypothetical protein